MDSVPTVLEHGENIRAEALREYRVFFNTAVKDAAKDRFGVGDESPEGISAISSDIFYNIQESNPGYFERNRELIESNIFIAEALADIDKSDWPDWLKRSYEAWSERVQMFGDKLWDDYDQIKSQLSENKLISNFEVVISCEIFSDKYIESLPKEIPRDVPSADLFSEYAFQLIVDKFKNILQSLTKKEFWTEELSVKTRELSHEATLIRNFLDTEELMDILVKAFEAVKKNGAVCTWNEFPDWFKESYELWKQTVVLDTRKARELIGWIPQENFEKGVEELKTN